MSFRFIQHVPHEWDIYTNAMISTLACYFGGTNNNVWIVRHFLADRIQ